jgi:NitT/TauT family transport system substrate-binding protein
MKIGVTAPGSSTNYFVNTLLARDGLAPDSVSIIGVGAGAGAVAGMQRGDIDAISNLDPVITQLELSGAIVPVVDTRTIEGMKQVYGDAYAAGCIYAPADFSKKNPKTAQAIVNAMVRAVRWIAKATPEQIVATVPPEYYGSNKALYETALKKNMEGFSPDGMNSTQAAENVYKVLKAFDPLVQKAQIDLGKTFNNTFVQQALKKYP